jgi:hypothetical protein
MVILNLKLRALKETPDEFITQLLISTLGGKRMDGWSGT